MKKLNNIKFLSFLFFIGLIATSCVHDDDYNVPEMNVEEPNVNVNTDIVSVKAMFGGYEPVRIETGEGSNNEMFLEAYVVSSDESGNIYKQLFIQDAPENPTAGVVISVNATDLYTKMEPGRKIYFRVDGLYIGKYAGLPSIGTREGNEIGRIGAEDFQSRIYRSTTSTEPVPTVIPLTEKNNPAYLATLVKFENVQFPDGFAGVEHYGNLNDTYSVNRTVEDCDGNTVILRNSGFSDFKNMTLPEGNGELTAILSIFNNDIQLFIRDTDDVQMNGARCDDGDGGGDGGDGPSPDAMPAFAGADFENWQEFLGGLNSFGIQSYATQSAGTGIDDSASLKIATNPSTTDRNDYVFTSLATTGLPTEYSKISFYMKGTADKSVSLNVYKTDGSFYAFNLEDISSSKTLSPAENNQYNGSVNTGGEWIVVTLNLSTINDLNVTDTAGNFFALKIGKSANYDLHFDNFTIE